MHDIEIRKFKDTNLITATKTIATAMNSVERNMYAIAATLAVVDDMKYYEADGFKNAAEYAEKVFGMKKSSAYNFIKIGREYVATNQIESNLPHDSVDFSTSQVIAMLPLKSREKAVELIEAGEITPTMTCEDIAETVKVHKPEKSSKAVSDSEPTDGDNCDEYNEVEEVERDYRAEMINDINACVDNLLSKYVENGRVVIDDMIKEIRKAVNELNKRVKGGDK